MQIFLVGNSIIFRLTDKESICCYKKLLLGKTKTTGTLWYQFIKFPLPLFWLSVWYALYFGSSVESFVYLKTGIWRGLSANKQYPTPAWYGVGAEYTYNTYEYKQWVLLHLVLLKSPNFIVKDLRNTFTKNMSVDCSTPQI